MSARLRAWFHNVPVAPTHATAADGDLVTRFTDVRDEDAFSELMRRHGPMVLATCRRVLHPDAHTADDAFQATFLVLATKSSSISPPDRVGAWLHGVAVLVARKAQTWARKLAPAAPADMEHVPAPANTSDPDRNELRAKIDDVLAGLPTKYRSAVVLCDLEQLSRTEAARALGWSEGALSGRLHRARKLLADRLERRGVSLPALTATGLAALLPAPEALASVSPALTVSTLRTVSLVAAGPGAGEGVPAPVAALAQSVPLAVSRFKLLAAGVTGVAVALGGFGLYSLTAAEPPASPSKPPAAALRAQPAPAPAKGWVTKHTLSHKSAVTAVAVGPNVVAAGDKGGVLLLWDTQTGKQKEKLLDGQEAATSFDQLQVSPDGAWLYIVTDKRGNYHQCSINPKDRLFPGSGSNGQAKCYGVTSDGAYWLESRGNRTLGLMENRFGDNIIPFLRVANFPHMDDIDFAAAGEADQVGTVSGGVLRCWAKGKDKPVWEEKLDTFKVASLTACPLSKVFAVGGKDGEVRVYAGLTGKILATLKGHEGAVLASAFSPDGKRVVTGGTDKTVRLFDAETGKQLAVLKGHTDAVNSVAFSPDGELLASGSTDKTAKVWEFKK